MLKVLAGLAAEDVTRHLGVSRFGGTPTAGTDYKGKFQSKMEDDWGYPYFRKPLFQGIREKQCDQCPGPLLVDDSLGILLPNKLGKNPRTGNPDFTQPGFNGIKERF